jgi:hypothetical protein
MCRRLVRTLVALGAAMLVLGAGPVAAQGGDPLARQFHAELNAERAARGVAPLAVDPGLEAGSQAWAGHLQGAGKLGHSGPGLVEIVGSGVWTGQVTDAWMRSALHRRLVVDRNLAAVGLGVSCGPDGRMWVVARFRQHRAGQAAPAAPPSPRAVPSTSGSGCGAIRADAVVSRLYAAALHRQVDAAGAATWSAALASGWSPRDVARALAASPEFAARQRSLDDPAFVRGVYRGLLGREPDPVGFAGWLAVARSAGRSAVLEGAASSTEFRRLVER